MCTQVRGKKHLVIEKGLAGPIGLFVKFSTLQDYGVDKVFFLENNNADVSQRNVVFIARGESAKHAQSIAGMSIHISSYHMPSRTFRIGLDSRLHRVFYPIESVLEPDTTDHVVRTMESLLFSYASDTVIMR